MRLHSPHLHPIIGAYLEGEDGKGEVLGLGHVVDLQQHRERGRRRLGEKEKEKVIEKEKEKKKNYTIQSSGN